MAINFFGETKIGTQVKVEAGGTYIRTKVEPGGTYNEYSAAADDDVPEEQKEPMVVDRDMLKSYILGVSAGFTQQNHWFAVVKPLMWKGLVTDGDYEAGIRYVHELITEGIKPDFSTDDIRKMDCLSMSKPLDKWTEDDAPISGVRFTKMKALCTAFWDLIKEAKLS